MKTILTTAITIAIVAAVANAAWIYENSTTWNNQIATPALDTTYTITPGWNLDTEDWYWHSANAIGFQSNGWKDINGGMKKWFGMKMEFSQPLASFQFTTPKLNSHICATDWMYSTDGTNYTNIWHRDAPSTYTTYSSEVTPLQTFDPADNVTKIWIRYETTAAYAGSTITDQNMLVQVTTVPEPATMMLLAAGSLAAIRRRRR